MHPVGLVTGYRGLCLATNAPVTSGSPAFIAACSGGGYQKWQLVHGELQAGGKCLTDPSSGGSGTKLVVQTCGGLLSQRWARNSAGEYRLSSPGLCLTDPGNSITGGTQVQVQTCANAADQHWSIP